MDLKKAEPVIDGVVRTPKVKLYYPSLLEMSVMGKDPNGDKKYHTQFLIPTDADYSLMKQLLKKAAEEKWGIGKVPQGLRSPFLDCTVEGHEGWVRVRVKSDYKPGVVGADLKPINDPSLIYGGRWAVIHIHAYAYDQAGNKGVAFGLSDVQLLDHGPALGGRASTSSHFKAVEGVASTNPNAAAASTAPAGEISSDDFLNT